MLDESVTGGFQLYEIDNGMALKYTLLWISLNFCSLSGCTIAVADPGENLTGALHSRFGRGGCGGRG